MLPPDAPAIINADDPVRPRACDGGPPRDVCREQERHHAGSPVVQAAGLEFDARLPQGVCMTSKLVGKPNVYNILAVSER
jgi:hypothetical protein